MREEYATRSSIAIGCCDIVVSKAKPDGGTSAGAHAAIDWHPSGAQGKRQPF
jgi:hypothetical protein